MSVVHNANRQPPICLGLMFLHGDSSFVTYLQFSWPCMVYWTLMSKPLKCIYWTV